MSKKINDLIKELEFKKLKIEFLDHILDSAKNYKNDTYTDVKEEVVAMLSEFVESAVASIESGTEISLGNSLTQEDVDIVKTIVNKVKDRPPPTKIPSAGTDQVPKKSKEKPKPQSVVSPHDQMQFALTHRHLADKTVSVANDQNMEVRGKVVGLDAPNVLVKTDAGPVIKVPVEKVSPV